MADAPTVIMDPLPFALVVERQEVVTVVTAAGGQGPPGRNGVDGATISPDPDNQLENRPNGLFVPPPSWQTTDW